MPSTSSIGCRMPIEPHGKPKAGPSLREHLERSLAELGATPTVDIFEALTKAYAGAGRHYHNREHVAECLAHFQQLRDLSVHPAEIEVAIWFHDAVYDTHQPDNEEKSAAWAKRFLDSTGVSLETTDRITRLIMATRTHEPHGSDAEIMLDVDLAILGAPPDVFEQYDGAIRREYDWVPEAQFREGRARILAVFLNRPTIYRTRLFFDRYERQARLNLARKIEQLRRG